MSESRGTIATAATIVAAAFSLFHLWSSWGGTLATLQQNYTHLAFALVLVFLTRPATARGRVIPALDVPLAALSVVVCVYPVLHFLDIAMRGAGDPTPYEVWFGVAAALLVIEATRRMLGWALPIMAALALAYAFLGPDLPGIFAHRGFSLERVSATLYLTTSGIAGTPLQVSATYVAIFVIFAAFLDVSGAGRFFIEWSHAGLGWVRGGPAKVAVAASALMGTVSGSAVANTVATGTFTIPIMKRTGMSPAFAGAVEATASSGGQIMPPVMGAAAFIMVEILGIPYTQVMIAAAIPAVLYFLAVLTMVDFEVAKNGIRGIPRSELPDAWAIFRGGWYLLAPLIVLVYLLVGVEYTPTKSAFFGVITVIAASMLGAATRMGPRRIWQALRQGGMAILETACVCACAGIVIGVLMLTGLALRMSGIMIDLAGGSLLLLLLITMVVSVILGMGLPTSAVYVILAILVAPAMIEVGVNPLAAHMFIFYFGVLANVTPPVAIAAYAGAGIAGADPTRTGIIAFRLALAGFILPFMWVYEPALLMQGEPLRIVLACTTAVVGILGLSAALQSYLFGRTATWWERILLGAGALCLIKPGWVTDIVGVCLLALALASRFWFAPTARPAAGTAE
ncbi:C4-dicarboxylate ABC transporter [Allostella sp. ATCC 35155]|nr:C4-dicarboxylate ABC transporter [Stella sp. ATCC 35155]